MPCEDVLSVIDRLEHLHDNCGDQPLQNLYLKLCLLECCGWVETREDQLLFRTAALKIDYDEAKNFRDTTLKRNSGFTYDKNLKRLLVELYGLHGVGKIESRMELCHSKVFNELKAALNTTLTVPRNSHAHTSAGLVNNLPHLIHFSVLRQTITQLEDGFNKMETEILNM
jgi:hypothetical protein